MPAYAIGVDFGTLSGRAVLADCADGRILCDSAFDYPHAVMDERLPDGTPLGVDWALQHPEDYLEVFARTVPALLSQSGVDPAQVVGVGIDFTACTLLPVTADGTPLCFLDEFKGNPNAYVKLWKHHAAQDKANRLNALAAETKQPWLSRYGGKVSSEWALPKIWQVLDEAPEVYAAAAHFVEAADWAVWQLTGRQTRNACCAGYKGLWHKRAGYPYPDFLKLLDPRLENLVADKLSCPVSPLGAKAGEIDARGAALTGLAEGTAVAVGNVDAHVTVPAAKIAGPGKMLAIMGTSTCHIVLGEEETYVPGICGVVEDGVYPGYFGYEAGQGCVGDHFAWFVDNCVPETYRKEARERGISIHAYLRERARALAPGESGLVALDWWNGNRSVLVDADLTGLMLGMTLQTRPEDMYRALLEATAYGTRVIVEAFRAGGVPVTELYAAGGIAQKDPLMMQIYADVLRMPIRICASPQAPALGSAIFGAVAAGAARGGWDDVFEAAGRMGSLRGDFYSPDPAAAEVYDALYGEYLLLHDQFGRGGSDAMKRLKALRRRVTADK